MEWRPLRLLQRSERSKTGGVISPILFCVYVDGLLKLLSDAKVGCYIGHVFVGALAYADDIVLLAPTARAMRKIILFVR